MRPKAVSDGRIIGMRGSTLSREMLRVDGGRFAVVASGVADGPSQAVSRFLVESGAREVWSISHPLVAESPPVHRIGELVSGRSRELRRPNRPPATYVFDPVTPLRLPAVDAWFGFNCVVTAQGLLRRRLGWVRHVIHWSVDFVPQRFGTSPLTAVYDRLDRHCILSSDGRVELSDAAFRGRLASYGLSEFDAPAEIVPMGSWLDEAPTSGAHVLSSPRLVFLGHLVERMGVSVVVDAVAELRDRGLTVPADIIGGGPLLDTLRRRARSLNVDELITFHGFVDDFTDVQKILAAGAVALAPYEPDETSFSRFADPGKLKAYLAAGLPILMTSVPPNAAELAADGGATIVDHDVIRFADEVQSLLADPGAWTVQHEAARSFAKRFDWGDMLADVLPRLGLDIEPAGGR